MPFSDLQDSYMQVQLLGTLLSNLDGMVYRCRQGACRTNGFVSQWLRLTGYREEQLLLNRGVRSSSAA
jgi:hypothetical protein